MFRTDRLLLRPTRRADAPAIFDGYASREMPTRFMDWPQSYDITETIPHVERAERCWAMQESTAYPWSIEERATNAFVGMVELRLHPPKADFGYILAERFWGRGYATEAVQVVVDWTMKQPEIWRLWATCSPENIASAKVLQKVGLRPEATLQNWTARPQLGLSAGPAVFYAKLRTDKASF